MMRRPRSWTQWVRRICQGALLALFILAVWSLRTSSPEGGHRALLHLFMALDPLIAAGTWLSSGEVQHGLGLAIIMVVATIVLGRFFCGWMCPFGTLHAMVSALRRKPERGAPLERRTKWHAAKYVLLLALLVMALFGVNWFGVFDPLSLLCRSITAAALPAAQYAVDDFSTGIYHQDPHAGPVHLATITEPVYRFLRDNVFVHGRQVFQGGGVIGVLFLGALLLNFVKPRFWCRYVCPLGGLLGLLARRPLYRLRNDESKCNNCARCNPACPAAAQPDLRGEWLPTECYVCHNCTAACNFGAVAFQFRPPFKRMEAGGLDLSRRTALAAGVGGMAGLLLFRLSPQTQAKAVAPSLITPPWPWLSEP